MVRPITLGLLGMILASTIAPHLALAAGPFDGTYVGTRHTTVNGNYGKCQNLDRDHTQLVVKDNVASYTWGTGPIEGTVKPDGSFEGSKGGLAIAGASGSFQLKGQITGPSLEADVGSTLCRVHLSLKKS